MQGVVQVVQAKEGPARSLQTSAEGSNETRDSPLSKSHGDDDDFHDDEGEADVSDKGRWRPTKVVT